MVKLLWFYGIACRRRIRIFFIGFAVVDLWLFTIFAAADLGIFAAFKGSATGAAFGAGATGRAFDSGAGSEVVEPTTFAVAAFARTALLAASFFETTTPAVVPAATVAV